MKKGTTEKTDERGKNEGQGKLVCVFIVRACKCRCVCFTNTTEEKDVVKFVSKPGEDLSRSEKQPTELG